MSSTAKETRETRAVVGTFFRNSSGRLTLDSLIVNCVGGGREFYDVDYSREYGYIFHMSGFGGYDGAIEVSGIYAITGTAEVKEAPSQLAHAKARQRNGTRRLRRLPRRISLTPGQDLLGWLEHNGIDNDAVWCATCRDWLPGDDLCHHTWWCNKTGAYSTPDDRCACKNREECRD